MANVRCPLQAATVNSERRQIKVVGQDIVRVDGHVPLQRRLVGGSAEFFGGNQVLTSKRSVAIVPFTGPCRSLKRTFSDVSAASTASLPHTPAANALAGLNMTRLGASDSTLAHGLQVEESGGVGMDEGVSDDLGCHPSTPSLAPVQTGDGSAPMIVPELDVPPATGPGPVVLRPETSSPRRVKLVGSEQTVDHAGNHPSARVVDGDADGDADGVGFGAVARVAPETGAASARHSRAQLQPQPTAQSPPPHGASAHMNASLAKCAAFSAGFLVADPLEEAIALLIKQQAASIQLLGDVVASAAAHRLEMKAAFHLLMGNANAGAVANAAT
jgi:hypothetical protein